ncbi:MAG: hypothetical protein QG635_941 [Bacteroidota bacterium]|nr:hypothetical protein [Bacteroidota bacterium]
MFEITFNDGSIVNMFEGYHAITNINENIIEIKDRSGENITVIPIDFIKSIVKNESDKSYRNQE